MKFKWSLNFFIWKKQIKVAILEDSSPSFSTVSFRVSEFKHTSDEPLHLKHPKLPEIINKNSWHDFGRSPNKSEIE